MSKKPTYNLGGFSEYQVKRISRITLERVRKTLSTPDGRELMERKKVELRERGVLK